MRRGRKEEQIRQMRIRAGGVQDALVAGRCHVRNWIARSVLLRFPPHPQSNAADKTPLFLCPYYRMRKLLVCIRILRLD